MADLNNLLRDIDGEDDQEQIQEIDSQAEETSYFDRDSNAVEEEGFVRRDSIASQENALSDHDADENDFMSSQMESQELSDGENVVDSVFDDLEYAQLKRLWITEMSCPELFPFDKETFDLHKNLLEGHEEFVAELSNQAANFNKDSSTNATSARDKRNRQEIEPNIASLFAGIYRMEADRVRFLLADLARHRLAKIEEHPLHMRTMVDRMSEHEVKYLVSYGELLEKHLRRTVLNHMPRDSLKKLDEPHMIDSPDLDQYVFCEIMENVIIAEESEFEENEDDDDLGGPQEYAAGSRIIARYRLVKDLVLEGKIQLLQ